MSGGKGMMDEAGKRGDGRQCKESMIRARLDKEADVDE